MKNTAIFLVAALDLFLYNCPKPQSPVQSTQTAAVVAKRQAPRIYFHSPLNAPAMDPVSFTSMGYFSTDSSAEFRGDYNVAANVTPVANDGQGALNWGDPNEAADIGAIQKVYKLPKVGEPRPTISQ